MADYVLLKREGGNDMETLWIIIKTMGTYLGAGLLICWAMKDWKEGRKEDIKEALDEWKEENI